MIDPREAQRMAADISALLDELGGPEEVVELDVDLFRSQLNDDDEASEAVMGRLEGLARFHRVSGLLLEVFRASLVMGNGALARACFAGVQALVAQARGESGEVSEDEE